MRLILLFTCRATAGILFFGNESTNMRSQHFGEHLEKLRKDTVEMTQPNKDESTVDREDGAVAFCQAARNV